MHLPKILGCALSYSLLAHSLRPRQIPNAEISTLPAPSTAGYSTPTEQISIGITNSAVEPCTSGTTYDASQYQPSSSQSSMLSTSTDSASSQSINPSFSTGSASSQTTDPFPSTGSTSIQTSSVDQSSSGAAIPAGPSGTATLKSPPPSRPTPTPDPSAVLPPSTLLIRNWCYFQVALFPYNSSRMDGEYPVDRAAGAYDQETQPEKVMPPNTAFWRSLQGHWRGAYADDPNGIKDHFLRKPATNVMTLAFRQWEEPLGGYRPEARSIGLGHLGKSADDKMDSSIAEKSNLLSNEEVERSAALLDSRQASPFGPSSIPPYGGIQKTHGYSSPREYSDKYGLVTAGHLPWRRDKGPFYSSQRPHPSQMHPNWFPGPTADDRKWPSAGKNGVPSGPPTESKREQPISLIPNSKSTFADAASVKDNGEESKQGHQHASAPLKKRNALADIILASYKIVKNDVIFNIRRASRCDWCIPPYHGQWWGATATPRVKPGPLYYRDGSNWVAPPSHEEKDGEMGRAGGYVCPPETSHSLPGSAGHHRRSDALFTTEASNAEADLEKRRILPPPGSPDPPPFNPAKGEGFWYPSEVDNFVQCRMLKALPPGPDLDWTVTPPPLNGRGEPSMGIPSTDSNCEDKIQLVIDLCPPPMPLGA